MKRKEEIWERGCRRIKCYNVIGTRFSVLPHMMGGLHSASSVLQGIGKTLVLDISSLMIKSVTKSIRSSENRQDEDIPDDSL